jgi:tetratricopeptide (TPR) repeat protein
MDQPFRSQQPTDTRLDSWKEIAAFFDRDERTVKRWEKERGLPVHRLPGKGKGGVFAYARELSDWLGASGSNAEVSYSAPARARGLLVELPSQGSISASNSDAASSRELGMRRGRSRRMRITVLFALVTVVGLIGAALIWQRIITARALRHSTTSVSPTGKSAHAANPEAEDLYLKGRYYWNKRTGASLTQAVDYFTQAIVHDQNFAPAYAGLADSYNLMREFSSMPDSEAFPRAIAAARKAVELDDSLSEAHRTLAFDYFWGSWDFPGAEREFKRAIELNPNDVEAYHWRATSFILLLKNDQATADIERARQLDPSSVSIVADRAYVIFLAGRHDEAITSLLQLEKTDPSFVSTYNYLATAYFFIQDWPKWLEYSKKSAELSKDQQGAALYATGERVLHEHGPARMLKTVAQKSEERFQSDPTAPIPDAAVFAVIGDKEKTFEYLQMDYETHNLGILFLRVSHAFTDLQHDSRYREMLARLGLPPVN